jgi:hypothetical protein
MSECREHQVELGLHLGDSSELDPQLTFGTGKPLAHGRRCLDAAA